MTFLSCLAFGGFIGLIVIFIVMLITVVDLLSQKYVPLWIKPLLVMFLLFFLSIEMYFGSMFITFINKAIVK